MPIYEIPLTEDVSTPLEVSDIPVYTPDRGLRDSAAKPPLTVVEFATTQLLGQFEPETAIGLSLLLPTAAEAPYISDLPDYHAKWPLSIADGPTNTPSVVNILFGDEGKSVIGYVYDRSATRLTIEEFAPGRDDKEDPLAQRFQSFTLSRVTHQYPERRTLHGSSIHSQAGPSIPCVEVRYAASEEKKPGSRPKTRKPEIPDRPEDISDRVVALAKAALKRVSNPNRAHPNGQFPNFFEQQLLRNVCSKWALAHHSLRGKNLSF
jgi:hypothetical protein